MAAFRSNPQRTPLLHRCMVPWRPPNACRTIPSRRAAHAVRNNFSLAHSWKYMRRLCLATRMTRCVPRFPVCFAPYFVCICMFQSRFALQSNVLHCHLTVPGLSTLLHVACSAHCCRAVDGCWQRRHQLHGRLWQRIREQGAAEERRQMQAHAAGRGTTGRADTPLPPSPRVAKPSQRCASLTCMVASRCCSCRNCCSSCCLEQPLCTPLARTNPTLSRPDRYCRYQLSMRQSRQVGNVGRENSHPSGHSNRRIARPRPMAVAVAGPLPPMPLATGVRPAYGSGPHRSYHPHFVSLLCTFCAVHILPLHASETIPPVSPCTHLIQQWE